MRAVRVVTLRDGPCARSGPVASEDPPIPERVLDPFDPEHLQRQREVIDAERRAARRRGLMLAAGAAMVVIAVGVGLWFLVRGSSGSSGSGAAGTTTTAVRRSRPATGSSTASEIAAYKAAPLLQPAQIPVGWKPLGAQVIPKSKSVSRCDEVLVRYGSGESSDVNYLDVYSFPAHCDSYRPADARDVQIGGYKGWVSDADPTLSVLAEVDVGATKVQAETDLDTPDALDVLAKLTKLDLANPPPGLMPVTTTTADPSAAG